MSYLPSGKLRKRMRALLKLQLADQEMPKGKVTSIRQAEREKNLVNSVDPAKVC